AALVLVGLASACASAPPAKPKPNEPTNTIATSGPKLGAQQIEPTKCISGGRYLFLGVDLIDERSGLIVRLVYDPLRDEFVRIFDPKLNETRTLILSRANCKTFKADLTFGDSMVNGIREMKASIDLDCETPGGNFAVGKVASESCL
ncbi:MAG TPA: hypothetical protein VN851_19820, partial [Thermoanaerobaculia bacterium]|nr:hypothetical protein [Thermoanaerobaculia bacterium]